MVALDVRSLRTGANADGWKTADIEREPNNERTGANARRVSTSSGSLVRAPPAASYRISVGLLIRVAASTVWAILRRRGSSGRHCALRRLGAVSWSAGGEHPR